MPTYLIRLILLLTLVFSSCNREEEKQVTEENILEALNALEDLVAAEISPQNDYKRQFSIDLTYKQFHKGPGRSPGSG